MNTYKVQLYTMQQIFNIVNKNESILNINFIKSHIKKRYDINIKLMDENGNFDKNIFYYYMRNSTRYNMNELFEIINYFIENGLKISNEENYFYMILDAINEYKELNEENIKLINGVISKLQNCGMITDNVKLYFDYTSKENKCLLIKFLNNKRQEHKTIYFSSNIFKLNYTLENIFHYSHLIYLPTHESEILINTNIIETDVYRYMKDLKSLYHEWNFNNNTVTIKKYKKTKFIFGQKLPFT